MSGGTYGGEDVNAIVIDFGSHSCKVGFGGEFEPKLIIPSVVGKIIERTPFADSRKTSKDSNNNEETDVKNENQATKKDQMETDQHKENQNLDKENLNSEKNQTSDSESLAANTVTTNYLVGSELNFPRDNLEIIRPVAMGGIIHDFDGYKEIIKYAYKYWFWVFGAGLHTYQ